MGWMNDWRCWSDRNTVKPRQAPIHQKLGCCKDVVLNSCFWKAHPECKFKRDMLLPWRRRHSQVATRCPDLECVKFIFNAPPRGIWKKKLSSAEVTVILGVLHYPLFFKLFVACNPETRIININITHSKQRILSRSKLGASLLFFLPGQSLSHYVVQSVQAQFGRWDKEQSPLRNCDQVFEQGVSGVGRMNHSNHSQWLFQAWWNQSTQCLQPSHCAQPALGRTVNKLLGGAAQKVAKQRARVSPYHAIYLKEHQVPRTCKTFRTQLMQPCLQQHRVHQHGQHICACFCSWTAQLQWHPHDSGSSGEKHVVHDWIFHSLLQQRRSGPVGLRLVWGEGSPFRNWLCGHPVTKSPSAGLQWQTAGLVQGQEHARSWVDLFHGTLLWLKFQAGKDL